jgi:hypothetical protein
MVNFELQVNFLAVGLLANEQKMRRDARLSHKDGIPNVRHEDAMATKKPETRSKPETKN